ncbi:MAG: ATP-binding protein [Methanosarcinaceae archaeon]|nr:ATP-binding protein [Methanosarcinaceae archaeon]
MKIINDISIKNFKGIEEMDFPCGSINIIVGPNNTGKSSILQSIWLAITSLKNYTDVMDNEISEIVVDEFNFKYLVNQGKEKSSIQLNLFNEDKINLDIIYSNKNKYYPELSNYFSLFISDLSYLNSEIPFSQGLNYRVLRELQKTNRSLKSDESKEKFDLVLNKISNQMDSEIKQFKKDLLDSEKLFIQSTLNNNLISIYTIADDFNDIIYHSEEEKRIVDIPLIISSPHSGDNTPLLYEKLFNAKKISHVLENLKNKISYLENIGVIDDEIKVSLKDIDQTLPLSSMGDGFKGLLKLSFMAPLIKHGIVLFEEPEISMHPGYFEILAKEIVSSSHDSQFFITTHSLEFLEYLLEKSEKLGVIDSVKILRLTRRAGNFIDREVYSGIDAKKDIEDIKIDLRGY